MWAAWAAGSRERTAVPRFAAGFLIGFVFTAYALAAQASGLATREWSGTAQGNSYAGATAGAEDVSFMAFNPAGLTRHRGDRSAITFSYIAPHTEFSTDSATTILTGPITGGNGGNDGAPNSILPALYFSREFSPRLFGGVSLTVPFGLSTEYDNGWVGRYHAIESVLKTIELSPVLAFKVTPRLSVGGGLRLMYADGVISNAVDFGTINAVLDPCMPSCGGTPTMDDGFAEVEGDDFGWGYNFGFLYQLSDATRIGAAYRSRVLTNLEGRAHFSNGALGDAVGTALGGAFVDTGISAEVDLPESVSMGIHHDLSPRWSIMAEAAWTRWSRFKELRVKFDNPLQADSVVPSDWENSWFVALGATYRPSRWLTARFGVAFDQSPTPNDTRTPRVPDEDRTWVSAGLQIALGKNTSLDIAYTHLFVKDASIDLSAAAPENTLRGNLSGSFDVGADIFLAQFKMEF
jgi:long-chain fatty acid transport protein